MRGTRVVIIGAGPYGLSIAAHLKHLGIEFRIFGEAMETWTRMPAGMQLKSAGFASNLSHPDGQLTLQEFALGRGLAYDEVSLAIPLADFLSYGQHFQQQFVPELERSRVVAVVRAARGYVVELDTGEAITARQVVVATGVTGLQHVPKRLLELPVGILSHSGERHDIAGYSGREVAVIGRGSSALDYAALLQAAGARVTIIARRPPVVASPPVRDRPLWLRLRHPRSGLGDGWGIFLCSKVPHLFRRLPERTRVRLARTYLGPAGGWHLQGRLGGIPIRYGRIGRASTEHGKARLEIAGRQGAEEVVADAVIAATGYRVELGRLAFLEELAPAIGTRLSPHFETALPGLYLAGILAMNTFGPAMRFVCGSAFAARRLARHIRQSDQRHARRPDSLAEAGARDLAGDTTA